MNELAFLLKRYRIDCPAQDMKLCLTHSSFSEKNNSRLVFLGQFAFRGKTAEWISVHTAGTGTQLQHFLGNVFRQEFLQRFFDKYKIKISRTGMETDIAVQKHVFVFAFLGLVYEKATEEQLNDFIFREIILPNNHLLPSNHKSKNRWQQLVFLCKQDFQAKPRIKHAEDENKIHHISVFLGGEGGELGSHSSVSFTYAKKKAVENALKKVASLLEARLKEDSVYLQNEKIRSERRQQEKLAAKQTKQQKHQARIAKHREKMKQCKAEQKILAQQQDAERRQAKLGVKEQQAANKKQSAYREYTPEEIKAMSNAKRRNLQDRGILPQNIKF